jgi:regulator of sigma E protease
MDEFAKQVIAFLIVLGPLVMLHELGHFWLAKRAGIRVLEFGFGFPPRAKTLWRGRGSLKIGSRRVETPRNFRLPAGLADGKVVRAIADKVGDRLIVRSITVLDDEAASVPSPNDYRADEARLYGEVSQLDPGTIYSINWLPIGGFVRMLGEEDPTAPDSFAAAPKRWRTAVLLGGPGMNIVAALVIFTAAFMLGQLVADQLEVAVGQVVAGSPAEQAGLQPGMVILAVEDVTVDQPGTLTDYTRAHLGQTLQVTVRDAAGEVRTLDVLARSQPPEGEGPMGITIGARAVSTTVVRFSLPEATGRALNATLDVLAGMIRLPSALLAGEIDPQLARPVGPAGIAQMTSYAIDASVDQGVLFPILNMAGVISVALAFTNLLPLPALDGGRLVFVLLEAIRGRRIAPEKEAMVHFAGMMFILALAVLITIQDVSNPIPNPF